MVTVSVWGATLSSIEAAPFPMPSSNEQEFQFLLIFLNTYFQVFFFNRTCPNGCVCVVLAPSWQCVSWDSPSVYWDGLWSSFLHSARSLPSEMLGLPVWGPFLDCWVTLITLLRSNWLSPPVSSRACPILTSAWPRSWPLLGQAWLAASSHT
jgi:hypothetical protein